MPDEEFEAARPTPATMRSTFDAITTDRETGSDLPSAIADEALPALDRALDRTQSLVDRGMLTVQDVVATVRAKAGEFEARATAYTREQPTSALLIAAAAGAATFATLMLLTRRRD